MLGLNGCIVILSIESRRAIVAENTSLKISGKFEERRSTVIENNYLPIHLIVYNSVSPNINVNNGVYVSI